jgi:hypothetical protein
MKTLISLFDYSGIWSEPYKKAGWDVVRIDIKKGYDIFDFFNKINQVTAEDPSFRVNGILAAPPFTHLSSSGAHKWSEKDIKASVYDEVWPMPVYSISDEAVCFIMVTMLIIERLRPIDFWALENPVGRLNRLIPELQEYGPWYFHPCDYGDPYTKKTGLWGVFNKPIKNPVLPLFGSIIQNKYSSTDEKKYGLRSKTPKGFARAFYEANH